MNLGVLNVIDNVLHGLEKVNFCGIEKVNLWYDDVLLKSIYSGSLNQYKEICDGFLGSLVCKTHNLCYKKMEVDVFNPNKKNIVIVPFEDVPLLKNTFYDFPFDLYDFCLKNNMYFLLAVPREHISIKERAKIDSFLAKVIMTQIKDPSRFLIWCNGIDNASESKYKDFYIYTDIFPHLMRNYMDKKLQFFLNIVKTNNILNKRTYNFSMLCGQLRSEKCFLLLDCYKEKLLDDKKFFYNIFYFDKNWVRNFVLSEIKLNNYDMELMDVISFFKKIFQTKIYDVSGNVVNDKNVFYDGQIEWQIPYQVLDSWINIVVETNANCPFITEKMYKPIIAGIPFIWSAYPNTLEYLQSMGYEKYPFIDYSFDKEPYFEKRRILLIEEIKRLGCLDLKKEVLNCIDISEYNRKIFYKNTERFLAFENFLND